MALEEGAHLEALALGAEVGVGPGSGQQVSRQEAGHAGIVDQVLEAPHEDRAREGLLRPEVEEVDARDAARQAPLADQGFDEAALRLGEGEAVHADAAQARVLEEGSPADAHVEHVHARLQLEGVEGELELARLGLRGVVVRRLVEAVGVGAPALEPGQEELGRAVVVGGDRGAVPAAAGKPETQGEEQAPRRGRLEVEERDHLQRLAPVAAHLELFVEVGLGEREGIAAGERGEGTRAAQADLGCGRGGAEREALSAGKHQAEPGTQGFQLPEERREHGPGHDAVPPFEHPGAFAGPV